MAFENDYPDLAVMFDELQRGIQGKQYLGTTNTLPASLGKDIAYVASWHGIGPEVIATGLRMVADAIDPPITPEEEAWIAENMGGFDENAMSQRWWKQRPGLRPRSKPPPT